LKQYREGNTSLNLRRELAVVDVSVCYCLIDY
jgi:hypothetical protein